MKHSLPRRAAALALASLMCFGMAAAAVAAILPVLSVSAAEESVESHAPGGTALVSAGSSVSLSACTNERAGAENSYEMPSETWAKALVVDGKLGNGGWSSQPYDRESDVTKPITLTLALPREAEVTAVSLFPQGVFPRAYELQVSADGKTFTTVASDREQSPHNATVKTYTFAARRVTHVRLHITERNPATGRDGALVQLGELAVWGTVEAALTLDRPALELYVGETDTVAHRFVGVQGAPSVTYKSNDTAVVTVDASGKLTAKGLGKTTVTVTCPSLGLSTDCAVEVVTVKHDFNENINLSIFWPPTPAYITDEQYKLMADAGINWVMGAGEETLATPENQRKMLELCAKYGIGMTVHDGSFGDNLLGRSDEVIASFVERYKNVPAAYGFYMRDEPFNPNAYIDAYIALKKAAPEDSMHLNFLPLGSYGNEYTYKAQMNDWCRLTAASGYPIEYLMFDQYPFPLTGNGMNRSGFFQNTRACWEVGLANDVKTGMYIQTVCQEVAFRRPSASEIRYEMYAALAFGYKQLSFFTWFTPVNRSEPFRDGIISADGTPNEHYETVKTINHEILAIGETLVKCDALEVWFNGPDTYGQPAVPEDFFVQAGKRDSVILSYLRHKETGRGYLMVVNNVYTASQEVELTFDAAITSLSEVSRTDGSLRALAMDGQTLTLKLAAGDAMLIALPEGYDYYEAPSGQPAATENLAAGATVTCPTSLGSDGWYMYNLTDGVRITGGASSANGWRSEDHRDSYILIDLGRALNFNRIDLYAAGTFFDYGQNFPKTVKVSVSSDGESFTEVQTFSELTPARLQGNKLMLEAQNARYIRLDLSGLARRDRYAALNEIEVYSDDGTVPAPEVFRLTSGEDQVVDYKEGDNLALNKEAFASSTTPDHYKQWGWALEYINNGRKPAGSYTAGWTSNVGRNPSSDATEYIGIDFGDVFAVDKIVIQPHGSFPVDYTIDLSVDGMEWTVVSQVKGAETPNGDLVLELETPIPGRFIRMTATKLGGNGGNSADGYLFQLGEIEAYGTPICDKSELEAALEAYRENGGDESAALYTDALAALDDPLLTQSRADDYERRLLAAVGLTPEPDETEPPVTEPPVTDAPTDVPTDIPTEAPTSAPIATGSEAPAGTEAPADENGCASAASISALLMMLVSAAFVASKRR